MTTSTDPSGFTIAPIARGVAERLIRSNSALEQYLVDAFKREFGGNVVEVLFEKFPDGLAASLFVEGATVPRHNVWAVALTSELADVGIDVHVVVRSASDLEE